MATNADEQETEVSEDAVAELAAAMAEAKDPKPEAQVTDDEATKAEESTEAEDKEQSEPEATFTKLVPSIGGETLEEHYALVAKAYSESTKEALRLKGEVDKVKAPESPPPEVQTTEETDPDKAWIKQLREKEIAKVWSVFTEQIPELADPKGDLYQKFTKRATVIGKGIWEDDKYIVEPADLYAMTAASLGLKYDDSKDRLGAAVKGSAGETKVSSGPAAPPQKSKVTEDMIKMNQQMYPSKTRQEIIEELEPHVQ